MRLLVSVATAADARAAVEGGADIVDAKDPGAGALGAVTLERLREIREAVAGARPLTAALGEAADEAHVERDARAYAEAGATLVKIGLLGTIDVSRAESLLSAAVRGVSGTACGVVAVAYADAHEAAALSPWRRDRRGRTRGRTRRADRHDAQGRSRAARRDVARRAWRRLGPAGRAAGLLVAVAGKLTAADLSRHRSMPAPTWPACAAPCVSAGAVTVACRRERCVRDVSVRTGPRYFGARPVSLRNIWFSWQMNSISSEPSGTICWLTRTVNGRE